MKLVLLAMATFLALFAFDAPTGAGCCGGSGGGGAGLFGRGLFGSRPFSRMRTRFADRRAARTNASVNTAYASTVTFGAYDQSAASFSSTYQSVTPSTQSVPATSTVQAILRQAILRQAPLAHAPPMQAPPARANYQVVTAPRAVVRQPVRNQTFGFSVYSGGCANGQCAIAR